MIEYVDIFILYIYFSLYKWVFECDDMKLPFCFLKGDPLQGEKRGGIRQCGDILIFFNVDIY